MIVKLTTEEDFDCTYDGYSTIATSIIKRSDPLYGLPIVPRDISSLFSRLLKKDKT